jgi:hypothetical protein
MNPFLRSKLLSCLKLFLFSALFPFMSKAQTYEKDSLCNAGRQESIHYMQSSNASLAGGLAFQGVGAAFIALSQGNSTLMSIGALAIVIGTVGVIDAYILKRKAKRKLLKSRNIKLAGGYNLLLRSGLKIQH